MIFHYTSNKILACYISTFFGFDYIDSFSTDGKIPNARADASHCDFTTDTYHENVPRFVICDSKKDRL